MDAEKTQTTQIIGRFGISSKVRSKAVCFAQCLTAHGSSYFATLQSKSILAKSILRLTMEVQPTFEIVADAENQAKDEDHNALTSISTSSNDVAMYLKQMSASLFKHRTGSNHDKPSTFRSINTKMPRQHDTIFISTCLLRFPLMNAVMESTTPCQYEADRSRQCCRD